MNTNRRLRMPVLRSRTAFLSTLCISLLLAAGGCASTDNGGGAAAIARAASTGYPLYELRTYTTNEGKLDALHNRFRTHTRGLFEKHGMQNVAYWTPVDKPNTLVYVIAHRSKEAATNSWTAFVKDPEWQAVYTASIADGRLVANIDSVFMTATDYSPAR